MIRGDRNRRLAFALILVTHGGLLSQAPVALADQVSLVADIGQRVPGQKGVIDVFPRYVEMAGALYFFHDDGIHGHELWRTDGTPAGTRMVADVCPGSCGIEWLGSYGASLEMVGGVLYFAADDGVHGCELWRSDGTAAGTWLVEDLRPGLDASGPTMLTAVGPALYFWADDGVVGAEPWVSDGTAAGTFLVADVIAGPGGETAMATAAVGSRLVFGFRVTPGLWATDGTAVGTELIASVTLPSSNANAYTFRRGAAFLALPNGTLLLAARTPASGEELWRSDGTVAGTWQLVDLEPGAASSSPRGFQVVGSEIYFTAAVASESTLWHSDGTAPGTSQVLLPPDVLWPSTSYAAVVGEQLFFTAWDATHGREPWVTDGVTTSLVADVRPGPEGTVIDPSVFEGKGLYVGVGDRLVFTADDGVHGSELWTSDGTEAGTHLLAELAPGAESVSLDREQLLAYPALLGGDLIFRDRSRDFGRRLWRTDGTPAGTALVGVIDDQTSSFWPDAQGFVPFVPSAPRCTAAVRGELLFAADDGAVGWEPWRSDGSEAGTGLLVDLNPNQDSYPWSSGSAPQGCFAVAGVGVFAGWNGCEETTSRGLWGVDPAGGEPQLLLPDSAQGWGLPGPVSKKLAQVTYVASDHGGVASTDGTAGGTVTIGTADDCGYAEIATTADRLMVTTGCRLAVTDGSPGALDHLAYAGVELEATFGLGRLADGTILFAATHPSTAAEVWRTDGTSAGTEPVSDVRAGTERGVVRLPLDPSGSSPGSGASPLVTVTANRYFFVADDGVHGTELWSSDGTPEGTAMVKDLGPGAYPSWPRELTAFDGKVFFVAEATGLGRELWVSDGTENGTVLVADIVPGEGSSLPQNLTVADGKLYFSAWDPLHGREAWRVLPTPVPPPLGRGAGLQAPSGSEPRPAVSVSGTAPTPPSIERLPDMALGPRSSSPQRFASVGGTVFTFANDNLRGFELWKIEEAGLIFRDGFESEDTEQWSGVAP